MMPKPPAEIVPELLMPPMKVENARCRCQGSCRDMDPVADNLAAESGNHA